MVEEFIGVVDRFEGDQVVILLESEGETVGEVVLPKDRLPADGKQVDSVLQVVREEETIQDLKFDPEETKRRQESVKDQFDRLSERPD